MKNNILFIVIRILIIGGLIYCIWAKDYIWIKIAITVLLVMQEFLSQSIRILSRLFGK